MSRRVLGVYREPEFSPGSKEADAAILDEVLEEMTRHGFAAEAVTAHELAQGYRREAELVLAMCQGAQALAGLSEFERRGSVVLNTPLAIRNCYRDLLGPGLARANIPIPHGALLPVELPLTDEHFADFDLKTGVYLKRGDLHALDSDDVVRVNTIGEAREVIARFALRRIRLVYLQQAVEGKVVKFYGVTGGLFFWSRQESGLLSDSLTRMLAQAASAAAEALGLDVWGGDAVVNDDGIKIVDFNDWPSFRTIRKPAARAIARRALNRFNRRYSTHDDSQA